MQSEEKVKILLVDEDENRLLILENILSSLDQNLVKAHSGIEALGALIDQDFAVALLDLRMPGMEGFKTAEIIRQREKSAHLSVIFVIAADCSETHLLRGCSLGVVDYIYTPIMPEILLAKVAVFVELKLQRERLDAEVKRNRFFSLSVDLLSIVGLDGYFRQLNPSWERTLGYTNEELKSKPIREFIHPDDREAMLFAMRKLAAGELVTRFENRYRAKDGSYRWLEWNAAPHPQEQLIYAVAHDVTERKQAETALVAAMQELESFSYSVSHDLRAPLRSIDGFSQALEEDCSERLDETGRRHLSRIRSASRYMGQLIEALLGLSRVARVELRTSVVDLSKLARMVARDLAERDSGRRVEFAIAGGVSALGDANLLRVVLENLLGNAWKFTAEREDARIEFGVETVGEPIYWVRDNGAGFDMQYAGKLFSPFQRLHPASEFPGTGIGLATVRRVVHRHAGRVWAESAVGQGTTIRFTFGNETQTGKPDGPAGGGTSRAGSDRARGEADFAMEGAAPSSKTNGGQP